ncbi:MAG: RcnB family protein, partial [Pseudomonadota bacterium]|nr:RcnB family protein [Pseudomonadota bacterium]
MRIIALGLVLAALAVAPAHAETLSNGKTVTETVFDATQKRVIEDFYKKHPGQEGIAVGEPYPDQDHGGKGKKGHGKKHKSHGKQGKGLPPGIAMNLERGKPLPPGIAKRYLPSDLEKILPALPKGQKRVVVGNDVLLVESATGVILD